MKDHDSNASDRLDSVSDSWGRAAAYDAYADGLHTYALGGLRNHEAAASAVYCTFIAADHHVAHLGDAEMLRPWLYAIARHYCRSGKLPRMRLVPAGPSSGPSSGDSDKERAMAELERSLLAAELASLDWPDTDGLAAAHREVLELSVRHGMESRAVGIMLGKPAAESFELLSAAWHELERSLAATALLRTTREHCADLAALAEGWTGRLTAARRGPLVAHVDACSRCQFHLHKVVGAPQAPSILPHVAAPKELRERVLGDLLDTGPQKAAVKAAIAARLVRFDEFGFPLTESAARARPRPETEEPVVEKKPRLLGALLAGRTSSAAAEAAAGAVASAPGRLEAKRPPAAREEGSERDVISVRSAGSTMDAGPLAPRRRGAGTRSNAVADTGIAAGSAEDLSPEVVGVRRRSERVPSAAESARAASVFDDLRPERAVPADVPRPRRNSVAAAIEGRRRGSADARAGAAPRRVSDAYEAAATVASAMAAGEEAVRPRIAPAGSRTRVVRAQSAAGSAPVAAPASAPVSVSAPVRRRKSAFRSALTSSAVLSGVGAAGVTAFVLFVPSSANGNKTLFTPPDPGGNAAQEPDYPRPTPSAGAGPVVPVAGGMSAGGGPGGSVHAGDTVTAQVVAAVVPATPGSSSVPPSGLPTTPGTTFGLPPATASATPTQGPITGTGQLNISVAQRSNHPGEVDVTLWNSGTAPVSWTATSDAPWLSLSAVSGILAPGAQTSVRITVDHSAEPASAWQAHVRFDPSGQMVSLSGAGNPGPPSSTPGTPSTPGSSSSPSSPSTSPSSSPSSTPSATHSSPSSSPSTSASTTSATPSSSPTGTSSQPSTPPASTPSTPLPTTPPHRHH